MKTIFTYIIARVRTVAFGRLKVLTKQIRATRSTRVKHDLFNYSIENRKMYIVIISNTSYVKNEKN